MSIEIHPSGHADSANGAESNAASRDALSSSRTESPRKSTPTLSVADEEHVVWSHASHYLEVSSHARGAAVGNEAGSAHTARVSNGSAVEVKARNRNIVGSSRATSETRSNTSTRTAIDDSDRAPARIDRIAVVEILESVSDSISRCGNGSWSPGKRKASDTTADVDRESMRGSSPSKTSANSENVRGGSTSGIEIAMVVGNSKIRLVYSAKSRDRAKEEWSVHRIGSSGLAKNSDPSSRSWNSSNKPRS